MFINAPGFKPTSTLHNKYWPLLCCLAAEVYGERTALRWNEQIVCYNQSKLSQTPGGLPDWQLQGLGFSRALFVQRFAFSHQSFASVSCGFSGFLPLPIACMRAYRACVLWTVRRRLKWILYGVSGVDPEHIHVSMCSSTCMRTPWLHQSPILKHLIHKV